jgi:hypothetical protein
MIKKNRQTIYSKKKKPQRNKPAITYGKRRTR